MYDVSTFVLSDRYNSLLPTELVSFSVVLMLTLLSASARAFYSLSLEQLGAILFPSKTYTFRLTSNHVFTTWFKSAEQGEATASANYRP